jgi:hypothetical protein
MLNQLDLVAKPPPRLLVSCVLAMHASDKIFAQIADWRSKLLDITKRNRLVNCKIGPTRLKRVDSRWGVRGEGRMWSGDCGVMRPPPFAVTPPAGSSASAVRPTARHFQSIDRELRHSLARTYSARRTWTHADQGLHPQRTLFPSGADADSRTAPSCQIVETVCPIGYSERALVRAPRDDMIVS